MRKIDTTRFRVATRRTSREINRTIVLNLVRTRQPLSRADLARAMGVRRGAVSLIVNELLKDGAIVEGATGDAVRGRKPTFLYIDSRRRAVVAIDIRLSQTLLMLADLVGKPIGGVITLPTEPRPARARQGPGHPHQAAAGRPRSDRRVHRHWRRRARHGRTALDARAARAHTRMARRRSPRHAGEGDGAARRDRKLGSRRARSPNCGRCTEPARVLPAISSSCRRRTASASA